MVEGHIQGWPFTFRTYEQEEKTKDPSHMALSSSAKLPVEETPESWVRSGIDYRRSRGGVRIEISQLTTISGVRKKISSRLLWIEF